MHRERRQLHAAAIYRYEDNLYVGDLQSHLALGCNVAVPDVRYHWLSIDLDLANQRILAATIHAWLEDNNGKIPYSVAHKGGIVFRDGIWIGDSPGQGLTCATFLVELFKYLGIPFIDEGSWLRRPGDEEWAVNILGLIAANPPSHLPAMTQEHVDAQMESIGETVRIRPSDVAAAGLLIDELDQTHLHFCKVNPKTMMIEKFLLD